MCIVDFKYNLWSSGSFLHIAYTFLAYRTTDFRGAIRPECTWDSFLFIKEIIWYNRDGLVRTYDLGELLEDILSGLLFSVGPFV